MSSSKIQLSDQELVDAAKEALMELPAGSRVPVANLYTTVKTRLAPKANQVKQKVFQEVLRNYHDEITLSWVKKDPKSEAEICVASLVEW
jgi:hypothetical protein